MADDERNEANRQTMIRAMGILTGATPEEEAPRLFSSDYLDHNAPADERGPDRPVSMGRQLRRAFPDLDYVVDNVVAEDNIVAMRMTLTGTHKGPLMGGFPLPPTGRRVEMKMIHMVRMVDGRIAEHWAVRDDLSMMRQLGLLPGGPAAATAGTRA
jgi:predicted ester cyclase